MLKYFIFGDASPSASSHRQRLRSFSSPRRAVSFSAAAFASPDATTATADISAGPSKRPASALRISPPLSPASILAKTYYNVSGHQPESVDWFNVLVAQTIAQLRIDAQHDGAILTTLNAVLNDERRPAFLDEIRVTEVNLGNEFPIFSNCRVIPIESGGGGGGSGDGSGGAGSRLQAHMDVDLSDALTLGIETKLMLNYPKLRVAAMPVALAVSVVRFSGTLSISFIPSPMPTTTTTTASPSPPAAATATATTTTTTPPTTLAFSFLPDYRLSLSTHSQLGSRARLQDVPKIAQLVEARLHAWFDERCVEPRFQQVVLPSLWPRKCNTRGGDVGGETGGEVGGGGEDVAVPGAAMPSGITPAGRKGPQVRREEAVTPTPRPTLTSRDGARGTGLRERRLASGRHGGGARQEWGVDDDNQEDEGYSMPGGMPGSILA